MRMRAVMVGTAVVLALGFQATTLHAQSAPSWEMPSDDQRCPSKWGAGDQLGSANLMTPETVLRAARLIRTGQVFELGDVLSNDPNVSYIPPGRTFSVYPTPVNVRPDRRSMASETVVTELGQIGTQFDGFAHQIWGDSFYNCFNYSDVVSSRGYTKLGLENAKTLMTRGVLIDVAALKGVAMLPESYEITVADLEQALARENMTLESGDAVVINTGWSSLMGKDNAEFRRAPAGLGPAGALWLVKQDPMLIAADNCCIEVQPSPEGTSLPVHLISLVQHGVHLIENLRLAELAAARAYEFAFVVQPLKIMGGTGSTVVPVAIR